MLEAQGNKPVDAKTRARYEAQAKILKALAHPSRLFIIDELARSGPRCVCELTSLIGADMSSVSRHLSVFFCIARRGVGGAAEARGANLV